MMKTGSSNQASARRGAAILLVLGALVFISILAVAFIGSINRELSASKSYASGASARLHADAAVNIVIGQLQAGTTVDDATQTWVSQPGLIRRYNNEGKLEQALKLYSSGKMIEGSTFSPLASGGAPSDVPSWTASTPSAQLPWNLNPGVYTDLNSPVVADNKVKYPILNPGGLAAATRIQGFDLASGYGLPDSNDANGNGNTSEIGQIPMPVRWLYILNDGRLAAAEADASAEKTVKLSLADGSAVSADNPPVARIAFWTDDDTCRLNINTASEGNYWTLPVAAAADGSLSTNQLTANEYQRYPGHPATTSLSPVLDFLTSDATDLRNFIFALSPRIAGRGSQSGSRNILTARAVTPDNDRLYASVDDLLFLPNVNTSTGARYTTSTANIQSVKSAELDWKYTGADTSNVGTPYSFSSSFAIDPDRLELIRFFLTANSRAPEVNLFGKPRVSLWPVDTRSTHQSIYDRLLAFCGTLNGKAYFFQRQNPASQTEDYDSIPRNQELLSYLDRLTSAGIPGLGGNFSDKYAANDRQQLLTSIFDWIRTVNLAYRDKNGAVQPYAWQANPAPLSTERPPGLPGSGQVLPIKINGTRGFGRFPTLSKAALAIVREEEVAGSPAPSETTVKYRAVFLMETYVPVLGYAGYVPDYQIDVTQLAEGFEFIADTPATAATPKILPVDFQNGSIRVTAPANVEPYYGRAWGGTQGYNSLFLYSDSASNASLKPRTIGSANSASGYPFVSAEFQVSYPTSDKDLIRVGLRPVGGGAEHQVKVDFTAIPGGQIVSSYDLGFPSFGPAPGAFLGNAAAAQDGNLQPKLQARVNQMADAWKTATGSNEENWRSYKNIIGPIDSVRGLELEHGDLRLLALQGTSPGNKFVPHVDYKNNAVPQAHSLLSPGGAAWAGSNAAKKNLTQTTPIKRGFLVSGTSTQFASGTPLNYLPQAPSSMTAAPAPGDFSTGITSEGDGPHVMKADEGNSSFAGMNWGMSVQRPYENQLFPYDNRLSDAFSPNRQVASAVQFGTLPPRAATHVPWQTLLFRPSLGSPAHPGAATPPDSSLLDLFWMPVADPYPISQPLSTAGKVNMNCQIAPFTYIERSTALLGTLKSVKVLALPKEHAEYYKWSAYTVDPSKSHYAISYLYDVDGAKTLLFFKEKFSDASPDANVFKSPSEVCNIPLAPKQNVNSLIGTGHPDNTPAHALSSVSVAAATDAAALRTAIQNFWQKNTLTGDNVLEAPYNHLYPRLTTQSDSYTVYVRAQTLQVAKTSVPGRFSEAQLRITGEYRGSYAVERYIDPDDSSVPDFAQSANFSKTVYPYYKFRIKAAKQFLP